MNRFLQKSVRVFVLATVLFGGFGSVAAAQTTSHLPASTIFFSPPAQTVLEGATFDVGLFLNTNGGSINTMDVTVKFPPDKLTLVKPSAGDSLIQLWLQPPTYSNKDGTVHLVGVIPNGVKTKGGLITTLTFTSLVAGDAVLNVTPSSRLLANDGLGTDVKVEPGRATVTVQPKPPGEVAVISDTHPFSSQWYNNNNVTMSWEQATDTSGFSYILDNIPTTVPDDLPEATGTRRSYESVNDGQSYFHIKARRIGVWGGATHFPIRIDTHPPAQFTPTVDFLTTSYADKKSPREALISFFTTDDLSGIDHYEVAVLDLANAKDVSPVFVQSESPFTLSAAVSDKFHVIVRAVDRGGNIRDASLDVIFPTTLGFILRKNLQLLLAIGLGLLFLLILLHYLVGHHIFRFLRRIWLILRREKEKEEKEEEKKDEELEKKLE